MVCSLVAEVVGKGEIDFDAIVERCYRAGWYAARDDAHTIPTPIAPNANVPKGSKLCCSVSVPLKDIKDVRGHMEVSEQIRMILGQRFNHPGGGPCERVWCEMRQQRDGENQA